MVASRRQASAVDRELDSSVTYLRRRLLAWHAKCGRLLPWRAGRTAFEVLIAEVLLQKTDANKVWRVYEPFIECFPDAATLAGASPREIRRHLQPLGLLYRATRLKQMASTIVGRHEGKVPDDSAELMALPGVGAYIAAAVRCFAFGHREVLVDANFSRVYGRYFGLGDVGRPERSSALREMAANVTPPRQFAAFDQAVLDFAATICLPRNPKCRCCPVRANCRAREVHRTDAVIGIDLFAGAGGLSRGAAEAGLQIAYAVEADPKPASTYEINIPGVVVVKERLRLGYAEKLCQSLGLTVGSVDVIFAGPPCQGFSTSNLRTRNDANQDNHLWRIVVEFARHLRPQAVVLENVGGMEKYNDGRVVEAIAREFGRLGYATETQRLNACEFGVPQHRVRLFIMCAKHGLPRPIVPAVKRLVTVGEAIGDLPVVPNGNNEDRLPYRLNGAALNLFQRKMRDGKRGVVGNCRASLSTGLIVRRFAQVPPGGNWQDIPKSLFRGYSKPENCHRWLYRRLRPELPAVTVSNFRKNMLIHPSQNRTLTVREAARLQSIDDGFVFLGNLQSQQQQVANAVPPPLAKAVTRAVLSCLVRKRGDA